MALGDIKIWRQESNGTWSEVNLTPQVGKILGFDTNLNPTMLTTDQSDFVVVNIDNVTGAETIWNPPHRIWYNIKINHTATTYVVTLSGKASSGSSFAITNVEHYATIINNSGFAKTLQIRLETTGHIRIGENLSALSFPAGSAYEISFIYDQVGAQIWCKVTKSAQLLMQSQA